MYFWHLSFEFLIYLKCYPSSNEGKFWVQLYSVSFTTSQYLFHLVVKYVCICIDQWTLKIIRCWLFWAFFSLPYVSSKLYVVICWMYSYPYYRPPDHRNNNKVAVLETRQLWPRQGVLNLLFTWNFAMYDVKGLSCVLQKNQLKWQYAFNEYSFAKN